jgi:glycosyltransferase involved in cell wall biosynthesis
MSSDATYKRNRMYLYIEKLTYRKWHHLIAVSKEVLRDYDEWVGVKGPATVLYNNIPDKFFAPGPKNSFTKNGLRIIAVGHLRSEKNYRYAIEAFKKMPPGVSLDIYGEGRLRDELQADIDKYQLNIRLCGHHSELEKILPGYDMLLMCSIFEGFSLALMEAMASGLPAILSNIPVLAEAAADSAVYVDIKNPLDFVHKVEQVMKGDIDLPVLSRRAHAIANQLARREVHLQQLETLYQQALSGR